MPKQSIDFSDRVALVCGAGAGGIGTATARMLAEAGAHVVAVDHTDALVDETRSMVTQLGAKCLGIAVDLRNPSQTKSVVEIIRREIGKLHLVANIAGGTQQGQWLRLDRTPDEVYESVFALNLDYVFRICRDAARLMIDGKNPGAIVNVASVSGFASAPYHGPYGAAKRAVEALTQTMAVEWGPHGIRANTVMPGSIRTPRAVRTGAPLDARQKEWAPLGRPVEKEEVASTVMFLLSEGSSAITGQTLAVDCGMTARCALGSLDYLLDKLPVADRE
jgi:NAD(P)-dependent dehydrogenase (short-subunit alcohol dehydrogenase family)